MVSLLTSMLRYQSRAVKKRLFLLHQIVNEHLFQPVTWLSTMAFNAMVFKDAMTCSACQAVQVAWSLSLACKSTAAANHGLRQL